MNPNNKTEIMSRNSESVSPLRKFGPSIGADQDDDDEQLIKLRNV